MTSARIRLERTPVEESTITMRCMTLLLSVFLVMAVGAQGFSTVPPSASSTAWWPSSTSFVTASHRHHAPSHLVVLYGDMSSSSSSSSLAQKNNNNSNDNKSGPPTTSTATATQDPPPPQVIEEEDPDAPAGIVGAEFFGGNKQKEEFYDPVAEAQVSELAGQSTETYHRFYQSLDADDDNDGAFAGKSTGPTAAFDSTLSASIGLSLQRQIQDVLYGTDRRDATTKEAEAAATVMVAASGLPPCNYAQNLRWETPFGDGGASNQDTTTNNNKSNNPLDQLKASKDFYKKMDVAIVGGRQDTSGPSSSSVVTVELFWEIAVIWPTFWAPHVMLAGSSTLTVQREDGLIVRQVDRLAMDKVDSSSSSLLSVLASQISPRFWDWYHIGMSPAAEQMPRRSLPTGPFADYKVFEMPGRLVTAPTLIETGTRDNRNAQVVPDHAFGCMIKTMGPNREDYVPTTPVEVRIGREQDGDRLQLSWSIPMSVEFQARNEVLPLPGDNPEAVEGSEPKCQYRWEPHRRVATIRYGGNVQDEEITDLRKRLYEQVTKDGWMPKLDQNGRPQFFFWQNDVKACYTNQGLGMCVYEWRPAMSKSNEVGIELEIV